MAAETSRRDFFKLAGAAGAAAVLAPGAAEAQEMRPAEPQTAARTPAQPRLGATPVHQFFTAAEAALVGAMADRLIPPDVHWPGAVQIGVVDYIDRQLAGAYGSGERLYMHGPWKQGSKQQGYQLPLTPAELYRAGLADVEAAARLKLGKAFPEATPDQKDAFLTGLEKGEVKLDHVPGTIFFETLLANTIEGFFCDPIYGGNRDMAAWRMVGFPGAYSQFVYLVDNHGMHLDRPPIGIGAGHQHG